MVGAMGAAVASGGTMRVPHSIYMQVCGRIGPHAMGATGCVRVQGAPRAARTLPTLTGAATVSAETYTGVRGGRM